ncbi:hypothetical protein AC249_AIPGENE20234 [Exaiptasia diaphana]|nr:hypothetical protein AC249_AIPGENE20234 [Exaiptasia diaphana]
MSSEITTEPQAMISSIVTWFCRNGQCPGDKQLSVVLSLVVVIAMHPDDDSLLLNIFTACILSGIAAYQCKRTTRVGSVLENIDIWKISVIRTCYGVLIHLT